MALNRFPADVKAIVVPGTASGAYASGDQIGTPFEIKSAVLDSGGIATVASVAILDVAKQDQAVDIVFFSQQPSTGTDNSAWNPSAADLAMILGSAKILTTSYSDGSSRSVGTVGNIGLKVKPEKATASQSNTSVWGLLVSRGTPNYGASAPTLSVRIGLQQD